MSIIKKLSGIAHSLGHGATRAFRTRLYGTRPAITSSASNALAEEAAIGEPLHSVYEGAKRRRPRGAPALKRQRSA